MRPVTYILCGIHQQLHVARTDGIAGAIVFPCTAFGNDIPLSTVAHPRKDSNSQSICMAQSFEEFEMGNFAIYVSVLKGTYGAIWECTRDETPSHYRVK